MAGIRWAKALEDNPLVLMDRVEGESGIAITQADIASIAYRVWEYATYAALLADSNATEIAMSASLTVADVVFDTLQTTALDPRWTADDVGYNFRFTLPAARLPSGSRFYRVEVTFSPSAEGEEDFKIVWGVKTTPVSGS